MQVVNSAQKSSKSNKNLSLPFTPKRFINDEVSHTESLQVSLWKDMVNREYPERKVLVSNLIHDREAVMLYSPTGVGKTWLSLAIGMICAGGGRLDLVEWENDEPQPVCYLDGEMLEEDIQERMKLLIPSLNLNEDELRKNFYFISRVSQPDDIEDILSFEEE